jgi:hypothetical protein
VSVRCRPLLPQDVRQLVSQVAATHPILGPRYGSRIGHFGAAIARTLGRNYDWAWALEEDEEPEGSAPKFLGAAPAVFVTCQLLREANSTRA